MSGHVPISDRGREVLKTRPERIDIKFLERYAEFVAFRSRKAEVEGEPQPGPTEAELETPEEALETAYEKMRERSPLGRAGADPSGRAGLPDPRRGPPPVAPQPGRERRGAAPLVAAEREMSQPGGPCLQALPPPRGQFLDFLRILVHKTASFPPGGNPGPVVNHILQPPEDTSLFPKHRAGYKMQ
jgi:hypothetical protein